ncbi:hypothetical protein [Allobranchiibius sp. CTAmp26]|uniref:hypothetical protein n=1 Tax=Allobranchiibius sp. CTAmp26 TaxID=2815214 RepID=UPI001AA15AE1|nr:hypothetical protein [Allobranchiibius sp. CTAmp26]MBO1754686.1 hypothetical protein [Allobranchiibius sp. CTAmp26]
MRSYAALRSLLLAMLLGCALAAPTMAYAASMSAALSHPSGTARPAVVAGPAPTTRLTSVAPTRVIDTRTGLGGPKGAVAAGSTTTAKVGGTGGVPTSGVAAVVLNITVTGATASGYLIAYATGSTRPGTSNITFSAGQTVANQSVTPVDASGRVSVYLSTSTQFFADVSGYYATGGSYHPVTPTRLLDTRKTHTVAAGSTTTVPVTGVAGVPSSGVGAVILNITVVAPATSGYLIAYPAGATRPSSSNVNFVVGRAAVGTTFARVGTGGAVSIYTSATTHLLVDIAGWLPTSADYTGVTPTRLVDTRSGTGAPRARVPAGGTLTVQVTGVGGVPTAGINAVELGVTAVGPSAGGYLTTYPAGGSRPGSSTLNYPQGQAVANSVTAKVGAGGKVSIFSSAQTDLLVDVQGYFRYPLTGVVSAWGAGFSGQLGNGASPTSSSATVRVSALSGVTGIAAGEATGYALRADGTVWAWGDGGAGELGDGGSLDGSDVTTVPRQVLGLTGVTSVAAGYFSGYALRGDGTVWAWGSGFHGELGNGSGNSSSTPAQVTGLPGIVAISAGWDTAYALASDGTVWAWGDGYYGQIPGTTEGASTPVKVTGISNVASIVGGGRSVLALTSDTGVWVWGDNSVGQLALNSPDPYVTVPTRIPGYTADAVAASGVDGYAIRGGGVSAQGQGAGGGIGYGSTADSRVPQSVLNVSNVLSIAASDNSAYARMSNGTIAAWGDNSYGELGSAGPTDSASTPVVVTGITGATAVAAGGRSAYAITP